MRGDFSTNRRVLYLSIVAVLIGLLGAFAALFLQKMITFFSNLFFFFEFSLSPRLPSESHLGLLVIIIPAIGGLIIGLMARYGSEKIRGHGIPEALEAILVGKSVMSPKVAVLKPVSSAVSIGSGGPFGAEGPIIMTGGAIGSLIGQALHVSSAERKTLLVAGAAAGMSATFSSPIAAVLLAVELLLFEWKPRSLVPVGIASAVAEAARRHLIGEDALFPTIIHPPVDWDGLLLALIVGAIAGLFSAGCSRFLYVMEDLFEEVPIHWMWRPMLGGLAVGLGGYFQPRVLGVGYDLISDLLQNHLVLQSVLAIVFVKCLVWVVSLSSGTSGGVLAPLLIMGAALGSLEASSLPGPLHNLWPLVSMAAVIGGMMRAPLTATIFALELTRDIEALPALFTASLSAYLVTVLILKRSILTEKVVRKGHDVFREYEIDPLERVRVKEVMTRRVEVVSAESSAFEVYKSRFATGKKHKGYPVLNQNGELEGVITISDILNESLEREAEAISIKETLARAVVTITPEETCRSAAEKMAIYNIGRLPVVSDTDPTQLIGIITRSDLLKSRYAAVQEEVNYERVTPLFRT